MSNTFDKSLQRVCDQLRISAEDRENYAKDMEGIQNFLTEHMKSASNEFNDIFRGLGLTGSHIEDLKFETPEEFILHFKLQFPGICFTPKSKTPNLIKLRANQKHYLVDEYSYVNWAHLLKYLHKIMVKIFGNDSLDCQVHGRTYKLIYEAHTATVTYKIVATDYANRQRKISCHLMPVFEFPPSAWCFPDPSKLCNRNWFAIPLIHAPNEHVFVICAPHWEVENVADKAKLKDSLHLMKALCEANDLESLGGCVLWYLYLHLAVKQDHGIWGNSMATFLIDMMNFMCESLKDGDVEFMRDINPNLFDVLILSSAFEACATQASNVLKKLRKLQRERQVRYAEVEKLFGLK